jgi:predicted dienelactone hydrolase
MVSAVGVSVEVFVDEARPTNFVAGIVEAAPTRTLPTMIWFPAMADEEPDIDGGPYPLIVLGHGHTGHATDLGDLASVLAANGYVVASPDFPETTGGDTFDAFPNVVHQPEDVIFTIDAILAFNDEPTSRYCGLINRDKIGIGGRSLGGATVLLTLYNTRFGEPRVRAAFCAAALEFPIEGTTYDYEGKQPLLVAYGDEDPMTAQVTDSATSLGIYAHAKPPKYLLTLKGQGHVNYFDCDNACFTRFSSTVLAFYDRYVKGDSAAVVLTRHEDELIRIEGEDDSPSGGRK